MKTIFIVLVCVVSLIAIGPLTTWGGDETPNPIWTPPVPNPLWVPSFEPLPDMLASIPIGSPPIDPIFDNLFSNAPHHDFQWPEAINVPPDPFFDNLFSNDPHLDFHWPEMSSLPVSPFFENMFSPTPGSD